MERKEHSGWCSRKWTQDTMRRSSDLRWFPACRKYKKKGGEEKHIIKKQKMYINLLELETSMKLKMGWEVFEGVKGLDELWWKCGIWSDPLSNVPQLSWAVGWTPPLHGSGRLPKQFKKAVEDHRKDHLWTLLLIWSSQVYTVVNGEWGSGREI